MMKYWSILFFGLLLFVSGCSGSHDSPENLSAAVVEAIADGDEDDLWELFAPEMRGRMVENYGKSEDEAKEVLLQVFQKKLKEKYSIEDLDKLEDDRQLVERICNDLQSGENKMSKIDDKWYINLQ